MGESVQLIYKALEGQSMMIFMVVGGILLGVIGGFLKQWKIGLIFVSTFPILGAPSVRSRAIATTSKPRACSCGRFRKLRRAL